jgi:hypothetical protein
VADQSLKIGRRSQSGCRIPGATLVTHYSQPLLIFQADTKPTDRKILAKVSIEIGCFGLIAMAQIAIPDPLPVAVFP